MRRDDDSGIWAGLAFINMRPGRSVFGPHVRFDHNPITS